MPKDLERVGPVLERLMTAMGLGGRYLEWTALGVWDTAVGEKIAARVRPVRVQNGVLWVQPTGPQGAAAVSMRKKQITEAVNRELGAEVLKDIRFVGAWRGGKRY